MSRDVVQCCNLHSTMRPNRWACSAGCKMAGRGCWLCRYCLPHIVGKLWCVVAQEGALQNQAYFWLISYWKKWLVFLGKGFTLLAEVIFSGCLTTWGTNIQSSHIYRHFWRYWKLLNWFSCEKRKLHCCAFLPIRRKGIIRSRYRWFSARLLLALAYFAASCGQ